MEKLKASQSEMELKWCNGKSLHATYSLITRPSTSPRKQLLTILQPPWIKTSNFLVLVLFSIFGSDFKVFWSQNRVFWASPRKTMQNDLEIISKSKLWTRNVQNLTKSRNLDMSGPAKTCPAGQVLTANQRKYFFLKNYTFPSFVSKFIIFHENHAISLANLSFFIKSYVLLNKFMIF